MTKSTPSTESFSRIGVVGLGAMGSGIAQVAIEAGLETVAFELDPTRRKPARSRIEHFLDRKVVKGRLTGDDRDRAIARLTIAEGLDEISGCDVVVEAVVEELPVKTAVFAQLDDACPVTTVLATNTSSLSVTEIAAAATHPGRVVGMHFFNPAPLMPLVEVIQGERSESWACERATQLAERLGKHAIRCLDTPGFVVNRVLIPLLNDCVRTLDDARVSPGDLDTAMKHGAGWPMGPCELLDLIGIDVHVHASEALWRQLPEPRMFPPPRLVAMARAGRLGRKTGEGFFTYDEAS